MCDVILHLNCGCEIFVAIIKIFSMRFFVLAFAIICAIFDYFDFLSNFELSYFTHGRVSAKIA